MKKAITILIICFPYLNCISQNYHPLLNDSCTWYVPECSEGCITHIYYTNSDTTINNKKYFKYYYCWLYQEYPGTQIGYLREDTLLKKVYYKPTQCCINTDTTEIVYYDFGLQKGDSILVYRSNYYNYRIETLGWYNADSVSLVSIKAGERKIIYLHRIEEIPYSYENNINWIEGVGYINAEDTILYRNVGPFLNCFYVGDNLIYKADVYESHGSSFIEHVDIPCNLLIGSLHELSIDDFDISYFSNSNNILIKRNYQLNNKKIDIKLYDINGRLIKTKSTFDDEITINISDLMKGIYIIEVCNDDLRITKKIVK